MSTAKLLIVEDEKLVAMALGERLIDLGYEIADTVATGEDAVRRAEDLRPDLVLMDIRLAGAMDGIEAARQIRERLGLPVIFLTAYGDSQTLERAKQVEPFGYILKPFDDNVLRIALTNALFKQRMEVERNIAQQALRDRESELRRVKERLRFLLQAAPMALYACKPSGRFDTTYMSDRVEDIVGYTAQETHEPGFWYSHVHPEDRQRLSAEISFDLPGNRISVEYRFKHKDGSFRWLHDEANVIRDVSGEPMEIVGFVSDITDLKRMENELSRSQSMAAIGSLAAGMAHEVRNPLFVLSATLDAFEARFESSPEHVPYIKNLRDQVQRLSNLMKQLLEFGRPAEAAAETASLEDVIADAVRVMAPLVEKANVGLVISTSVEGLRVPVEFVQAVQIFRNLVENAIQYSRPGGTVRIEAVRLSRDGSQWVECSVRDMGAGFQSEDLSRVFDPFFTRRRGGTGLGLAIVHRIVRDAGGEIEACNQPEGGALITLRLPAAPEHH
jgi:PAS domain S-box-containing protein